MKFYEVIKGVSEDRKRSRLSFEFWGILILGVEGDEEKLVKRIEKK